MTKHALDQRVDVSTESPEAQRPLRPGDLVQVRSAAEILSTLDDDASIDALPFMPEMLQYSGRRFTVSHRVEKICDTVSGGPPASRRMHDTVLLDDLRCDGSGHAGCQAGCRLYWKEAWLRRVEPGTAPGGLNGNGDANPLIQLEQLARQATRVTREVDGGPTDLYRCQATEAVRASEPLSNYDPRQYYREVAAGNVGVLRMLHVVARAIKTAIGRRLHLIYHRPLRPAAGSPPIPERLDLEPGDVVEVRSAEEIARTIDENGKTRGLWFDWEMTPHCGGHFRVRDRVERIIDERNGKLIEIASDCLILDDVTCTGDCSIGHWLCPRATYSYWREQWLRPAEDADPSTNGDRSELQGERAAGG